MSEVRLGLRANALQFSLLVALNALVGSMVGLERSVMPLIGEREFGLTSKAAILAFVLAFGLSKGLALLHREELGDALGALAHQGGRPAHDPRAFDGRQVPPHGKSLGGGNQGLIQVGAPRMGNASDFLACCGVDDGERAAVRRVLPLAINEKLCVGVAHENFLEA